MLIKKMNLQLFAEDPSPADSNPSTEPSETSSAASPSAEPKLFSNVWGLRLRNSALAFTHSTSSSIVFSLAYTPSTMESSIALMPFSIPWNTTSRMLASSTNCC